MQFHRAVLLGSLLIGGSSASYATTPAHGNADAGAQKAFACAACHGLDGNSSSPQFPTLAAQNAEYIAAQLQAFKDGRRANQIMLGMASTLSPQDMRDIAAHFASQKSEPVTVSSSSVTLGSQCPRQQAVPRRQSRTSRARVYRLPRCRWPRHSRYGAAPGRPATGIPAQRPRRVAGRHDLGRVRARASHAADSQTTERRRRERSRRLHYPDAISGRGSNAQMNRDEPPCAIRPQSACRADARQTSRSQIHDVAGSGPVWQSGRPGIASQDALSNPA